VEKTDIQLAADACRGDANAFGILVERYRAGLIGYVAGLLRTREDAEELAQEAFLRAWREAPTLKNPATFGGWLYRIAHNLAMSHVRKRRPVPLADDPPDCISDAMNEDDTIALLAAVNRLGEPHREVIDRKYFDRLTIEEVAGQLGIPAGTVRSRLSRAYGELRKMLTDESGR
jgi:RNA polymerase sigma-70 factor, ECF subfamily